LQICLHTAIDRILHMCARQDCMQHYHVTWSAQKQKSKLKFVTLDEEINLSTLWRREDFLRICSKEELAEKSQDTEVTIPVKKSQEAQYNLDPGSVFKRPDGIPINEDMQIYIF